jgi:membrane-bound serine protease (ClpP class)
MSNFRGAHSLTAIGLIVCLAYAMACCADTKSAGLANPTATSASMPTTAPAGAKVTSEGWFAPVEPAVKPPALPNPVTKAFILPIHGEISTNTFDALKRKIGLCRAAGAELIIFDMDTWGGGVMPALDISRMFKTELDGIRTVCYVHTRGVSAGALIALAANEIVIAPAGTLGDCAPISMGGSIQGVEREKIETVLRTEFAESAQRNGYNVALAKSMVSSYLEVWLIRNKDTSELQYVLSDEYQGRVDAAPGVTSMPADPSARWKILRVVVPKDRLLTMHSSEAVEYGFAKEIIAPASQPSLDPLSPLLQKYNVSGGATTLDDLWSETLVGFLTSTTVLGFLTFIGVICIYAEFQHPGLVLPAVVGILCFAIIFGARYLSGMALWWEIVIFAAGVILILLEIFVIPGFGVPGIAGIICCVIGLLAILVDNSPGKLPIPQTPVDWADFTDGFFALSCGFLAAVVGGLVLSRYLPKVPLANKLMLAPVTTSLNAAVASDSPVSHINVGDVGKAVTLMHPVGKVRFADGIFEATADGTIIASGATVRVLKREGNHLVVEEVQS